MLRIELNLVGVISIPRSPYVLYLPTEEISDPTGIVSKLENSLFLGSYMDPLFEQFKMRLPPLRHNG